MNYICRLSETRRRGKPGCVKPLVIALLAAFAHNAHALPTNGVVSAGSGSIAQNGSAMTVSQSSQNLAVNWQSFNIGAAERVTFAQPNVSAIALNRVLGSDPSQILGQLNANGQVWILNPNGLLFGSSAQVNVGGLVASTLNISDADFLAGRRTFSGSGGAVTNQGTINANYVALLGGQVSNEGVIAARLGTVALAAGNQITLDFNGDQLLNVQVDQGALDALAENKQLIRADGGTVLMTAQAADALASAVVNNTGVIEARSIENREGRILLLGDMQHGTVNVGGTLDASAPSPSASLLPLPQAGEGQGRGGFIETSAAHVKIADDARITTLAPQGTSGTWLIDPVDFTIAASGGNMTGTTLTANLVGGNVTILSSSGTVGTAGDVNVNDAVTWNLNKLTLNAFNNININANLNASGAASLALEYGQGAVAAGNASSIITRGAAVNLPAGTANFTTLQGSDGLVKNYTVITSLGAAGSVTKTDLQGMSGDLALNYALGANIDASTTNTWNGGLGFTPVGTSASPFTGSFDGLGHTVSGLYINRPTTGYIGLFGQLSGAQVHNIGLTGVNITGNNTVGALAGQVLLSSAVGNSYATGSVAGAGGPAVWTYYGGLLGIISGSSTLRDSYATVSVTGVHRVGGLVGGNDSATISNSYATGAVSGGGSGDDIGGLVGYVGSSGSVSNSYATGSVHGRNFIGGLVGWIVNVAGSVSNSYATGAVTGTVNLGGLVGLNVGSVTNSYWDTQTTGRATSAGGAGAVGKTTAEMQTQATFTGFDFTTTPVWRIYEGHSTPLLKSFLTPLTVTGNAAKTYDGLAYSGGGVSYSTTPNANLLGTLSYSGTSQGAINAGSYVITPSALYSNQQGYDISFADGALTVNTAPLTVTAGSASKTYDGLAWSGGNGVAYSGFVNGEGTGVLGGALVYGGTAQGAVNAGSYAITPSGLTASNYTIAFNDGTLTIGTRVPAIPGAPVDGYTGAIASVVASVTTSGSPGGSAVASAGGSTSASSGTAFLTVDSGSSAAGGNIQVAALEGAAGSSAQGESGGNVSSDEEAAADSFATEYELVTRGCGQRLPSGMGC